MKNAIKWVRDALATKDIVAHLTHYLVTGETIYASDGRMLAAHPFPSPLRFLVPGEAFEKSLTAAPTDEPTLKLKDGFVHITAGKFKSRIRVMDPDTWVFPTDEGALKWRPIPGAFFQALQVLRPFISDNATQPWATGVGLLPDGYGYATNNIVIARSPIGEKDLKILIPVWAVDFILGRTEGLKEFVQAGTTILFRWENGGMMRTTTLNGEFPSVAAKMIKDASEKNVRTEIETDWREVFNRVVGLSTNEDFYCYGNKLVGSSGDALTVEEAADTPLPKGHEFSLWDPKQLALVIPAAQEWTPTAWPQPAYFTGPHVEGLMAGRRQQ